MSENISRRQALKQMAAAAATVTAAAAVIESCSGSSAPAPAAPKKEAPEGSKVATRHWEGLGDISILGMGCMRFPTVPNADPTRGHNAELDQDQINKMVDYALAHGINYFDTAPAYGQSEKATGIALSRYPRESYYLATKMSNMAFGSQVPTLEAAKAMFENSLKNLQTDYIDFLLLHNIPDEAAFNKRFIDNGVLEYLIGLRNSGVIRHLGFSYHGSDEYFAKLVTQHYKWEFVQIQMNYADWKVMAPGQSSKFLYETLEAQGIPVVIMEPIKGGTLANVSDAIKGKLAERHPELSPAGCALSFAASYQGVMCALSGMSNMEQLIENVATFTDFKEFDDSDKAFMLEVADLYHANTHIPCTACSYCQPCPNGVDIPGNFSVFNTTSDELNIPDPDNQDADYKKKRKIFLKRYKALGKDAKADSCIQCEACLPKCPQHIQITRQLKMINDLVAKLG